MPEVEVQTLWDGVWRPLSAYPQMTAAIFALKDQRWMAALWEAEQYIKRHRLEMEVRILAEPDVYFQSTRAAQQSPQDGSAPPTATNPKTSAGQARSGFRRQRKG